MRISRLRLFSFCLLRLVAHHLLFIAVFPCLKWTNGIRQTNTTGADSDAAAPVARILHGPLPELQQIHARDTSTANTRISRDGKPEFQEPDIVCTLNGDAVPVAVKRLKNLKQLVKRIKEGAGQVAQAGDHGIISVDVVIAMNPKNQRLIAKIPDSAFGLMWTTLLKQVVDGYYAKIQQVIRHKRVLGVILHDHWLRMDSYDHWRLETMTYGVPAQGVDTSLDGRFPVFIDKYINALPNLTRIA